MKQTQYDKSIREIIVSRRNRILLRRSYRHLGVQLLLAAIAVWLLLTEVFLLCQSEGQGMFPALADGDLLLGYRLQKNYSRNDTVLYRMEGHRQVGRIVACENDVVDLDGSGNLRVNGTVQSGQVFFPSFPKETFVYPLRVNQGCYFILGDCRTRSRDSRDFGPVPREALQAKVVTLLRRRKI